MFEKPLIRYIFVGAFAYVVEMAALYAGRHVLRLSPLVAVAVSFWVGFFVAFTLQKFVAFQNHEKKAGVVIKQLAMYCLLTAWNYGFSLLLVALLTKYTSVFVIRTIAIMIITSWNFLVYGYVFGKAVQ